MRRTVARRFVVSLLPLLASASLALGQGWQETGPYAIKEMDPLFHGNHIYSDRGRRILYLPSADFPEATLERFKVHFVAGEDGVVRLMRQGPDGGLVRIDTRGLARGGASREGHCIYVMDAAGDFYVVDASWLARPGGPRARVKHSTLPAGRPVAAAGEMKIVNGILGYINNDSGHYSPENSKLAQAQSALEGRGVRLFEVDFMGHEDRSGEFEPLVRRPAARPAPRAPPPPATPPEEDVRVSRVDDRASFADADVDPPVQTKPAPAAPVQPDPDLATALRRQILAREPGAMDIEFMRSLYAAGGEDAGKVIGGILSERGDSKTEAALRSRSEAMARLRLEMDDAAWEAVLQRHKIPIQITNQGGLNGVVSDLDYTVFYLADRYGVPIATLIEEHRAAWIALHGLEPSRLEIQVMNGDLFYADFRNAALGYDAYRVELVDNLLRLRSATDVYEVPGANKNQVHDRALLHGRTIQRSIDLTTGELVDVPVVTQEAWRYRHVSLLHDYRNAFGVAVEEIRKFSQHDPTERGNQDLLREMQRRSKHFNRGINTALGDLGLYLKTYGEIYDHVPEDWQLEYKRDYLRRGLDPLHGTRGDSRALSDAELDRMIAVIDQSMAIERGATPDFMAYDVEANRNFLVQPAAVREAMTGDQKDAWLAAERAHLFKEAQKAILFDVLKAGLYYSSWRDLTVKGALRNALRFEVDPRTGRPTAMLDPGRLRRVVFDRSVEVMLMFETIARIPDPVERERIRAEVFRGLPDELKDFYRRLLVVRETQVDNFLQNVRGGQAQRDPRGRAIEERADMIEHLLERKIARLREAGIEIVDAEEAVRTVSDAEIEQRILGLRLGEINPYTRGLLWSALEVARSSDPTVRHAFRNLMGLMIGSSVVNLALAYQTGDPTALNYALFTEALNFAPDVMAVPFTLLLAYMRAQQGDVIGAMKQVAFFAVLRYTPRLAPYALVYSITRGTFDLARTYAVTRINKDLIESAFRSRPVDEFGRRFPDERRARRNPYRDAADDLFRGDAPLFPVFYHEFPVDEDQMSDADLYHLASVQLSPVITRILEGGDLTEADQAFAAEFGGLEPETEEWWQRARELTEKLAFDLPYYARMRAVYRHYDPIIGDYIARAGAAGRATHAEIGEFALHKFMTEAVMRWYHEQPDGYRREFEGYFEAFFGDTERQMLDEIVGHAIMEYYRQEELAEQERTADEEIRAAAEARVDALATVEKQLVATERRVGNEISDAYLELASAAAEDGARLLERDPGLVVEYPYTYATQMTLPSIEIDGFASYTDFKDLLCTRIAQEITGYTPGAPAGWKPEPEAEKLFEPDENGVVRYEPVTVDHRFRVQLVEPPDGTCNPIDPASRELAAETLDLPIVYYLPIVPFGGEIYVEVWGDTESGRPQLYPGARVILGDETHFTDRLGLTSFELAEGGGYRVTVLPREGDERHGEGSGSATLVDSIATPGARHVQYADIQVVLPYVPPPPTELAANEAGTEGRPPPPGGRPGGGPGPGARGNGAGGGPGSQGDEEGERDEEDEGDGRDGEDEEGDGGAGGGEEDEEGEGGAGGGEEDEDGDGGAGGGEDEERNEGDAGEEGRGVEEDEAGGVEGDEGEGQPMGSGPVEVWNVDLALVDVSSQVRMSTSAVLRIEFQADGRVHAVASYSTSGSWPDEFTGTIRGGTVSLTMDPRWGGVFEGTIDPSGLFASGRLSIDSQGWVGTWRATLSGADAGGDPTGRTPPRDPDTGTERERTDSDAERDLRAALGPPPLDLFQDARDLLTGGGDPDLPYRLLESTTAKNEQQKLLDRIGTSLEALTPEQREIFSGFAWMTALAQAVDVNGRRAFPAASANLSVLRRLAATALTDPDPSRAHEAETAMGRYAAFLRGLDVQALKERHGW